MTPNLPQQPLEICELHPIQQSKICRICKRLQQQQALNNANSHSITGTQNENEVFVDQELIEILPKGDRTGNVFKLWGANTPTMHLNQRLQTNILNSQYFKDLFILKTYHEVIEEITKNCSHAQPWAIGGSGAPSTMFCCLYKFMLMNLTVQQIKGLIDYKLHGLVRCCGFLYIRCASTPTLIWAWMRRYLLDDEEIRPTGDAQTVMTIGEYVEKLLMDQDYFQTRFPRIPISIDQQIKAKLVLNLEQRERKRMNFDIMNEFTKEKRVRAISAQDNEWHEGVISKIEGKHVFVRFSIPDDYGKLTSEFKGGEEVVNFGEIQLIDMKLQEKAKINNKIEIEKSTQIEDQINVPDINSENPINQIVMNKERKINIDEMILQQTIQQSEKLPSAKQDNLNQKEKHRSKSKEKHKKRKEDKQKSKKKHKSRKNKKNSRSRSKSSHSRSSSRYTKSDSSRQKQKKQHTSHRRNSNDSESSEKSKDSIKEEIKQIETNKEKEERIRHQIKQQQASNAVASSRSDVAQMPQSFKQTLDGTLPRATNPMKAIYLLPTPEKQEHFIEILIPSVVQAQEREEKDKHQPQTILTQDQQNYVSALRQLYGDAAAIGKPNKNVVYEQNVEEKNNHDGPEIYQLG